MSHHASKHLKAGDIVSYKGKLYIVKYKHKSSQFPKGKYEGKEDTKSKYDGKEEPKYDWSEDGQLIIWKEKLLPKGIYSKYDDVIRRTPYLADQPDVKHGTETETSSDGVLLTSTPYFHGKINGTETHYFATSKGQPQKVMRITEYMMGKKHGTETNYGYVGQYIITEWEFDEKKSERVIPTKAG